MAKITSLAWVKPVTWTDIRITKRILMRTKDRWKLARKEVQEQ